MMGLGSNDGMQSEEFWVRRARMKWMDCRFYIALQRSVSDIFAIDMLLLCSCNVLSRLITSAWIQNVTDHEYTISSANVFHKGGFRYSFQD